MIQIPRNYTWQPLKPGDDLKQALNLAYWVVEKITAAFKPRQFHAPFSNLSLSLWIPAPGVVHGQRGRWGFSPNIGVGHFLVFPGRGEFHRQPCVVGNECVAEGPNERPCPPQLGRICLHPSYLGLTTLSSPTWGPRRGVLMSHVDFKKYICRPVEFKKCSCRPVEFKKLPCLVTIFSDPMSHVTKA